MGLKILHSGDFHLDSPFAGFPEKTRAMLRQAQQRLPEELVRLCREAQAQLVLLAGDVFDGPYSRQTAALLAQCLEDCAVPVLIAPGNHDFVSPASPWQQELWPENVHVFRGNLSYVDLEELDCRVYGAGYTSMDCPGLLENFRGERAFAHTVGVFHGDAVSGKSPYCPVTAGQVAMSNLDYLALGHIHKGGSFTAGNTLCAWPGCPMGRGWDETGRKGMLLAELGDTVTLKTLPVRSPAFLEETVDITLEGPQALQRLLPPVDTGDLYRVTLTGRGSPDPEAIRAQFSHLENLELRDRTRPPLDPWAYVGENSLRGVYMGLLKEKYEHSQPEEAETVYLAAELAARLLEGEEVVLP